MLLLVTMNISYSIVLARSFVRAIFLQRVLLAIGTACQTVLTLAVFIFFNVLLNVLNLLNLGINSGVIKDGRQRGTVAHEAQQVREGKIASPKYFKTNDR